MRIPSELQRPIEEGLRTEVGGEVVVRDRTRVGHVYLYGGAVAWVTCDNVAWRLRDVLQHEVGIDGETLNAVLAECQAKRSHFGETLLQWGLITRSTLRQALLVHNARNFAGILELSRPLTAMFIPQKRTYSSDLLFTLEEIVGQLAPPAAPFDQLLRTLADEMPQCQALMAVDLDTGLSMGSWILDEQRPDAAQDLLTTTELLDPRTMVARLTLMQGGLMGHKTNAQHTVVSVGLDSIHVVLRSTRKPKLAVIVVCDAAHGPGKAIATSRVVLSALEEHS